MFEAENRLGYIIPMHLRHVIDFVEMSRKPVPRTIKRNLTNNDNVTDDRYFGKESMEYLYNVSTPNSSTLDGVTNVSIGAIEYQNNSGFTNVDMNRQQIVNEQPLYNITEIVGDNYGTDMESELDVQMISQTAASGTNIWYWQSPYWLYSFAVDFYNSDNVPDIISMSWGWSEKDQCDIIDCGTITSEQYVERVNNEYLKLALRGITIVTASGDAGAPGRTNEDCELHSPINPVFPGSSPYITSSGATVVALDNTSRTFQTPLCLNHGCIKSTNESSVRADKVGWTAGGGFDSYHNETPWWQKDVVDRYLSSGVVLPNKNNFNRKGRSYPDVSAIGHMCPTFIGGSLSGAAGTSCSAPVVASLLSIIHSHLWKTKHIKLGFANPLLYYLGETCPECFRDITDGYNWCTEQGCCTNTTDYGFSAISGYDPVSGLGTLNVGRILDAVSKLRVM